MPEPSTTVPDTRTARDAPPFGSDPVPGGGADAERHHGEAEGRLWSDALRHCPHGIALAAAGSSRIQVCNPALARMLGSTPEGIAGTEILSLYAPEDHPRVLAAIAEADRIGEVRYEAWKLRADGSRFPAEIALASVRDNQGALLYRIASVQDITARRGAEERDRIQRDLLRALAASTSLDEGLGLCLEAAVRVSTLDSGGFYRVDPATGALHLAAHRGLSEPFVTAVSRFGPESIHAKAVAEGRLVLADPPVLHRAMAAAASLEGLRFIAAVPVMHQGRAIGCLNVASHSRDSLPDGTLTALETIAAGAAHAIVRLQAQEELQASEERYHSFVRLSHEAIYCTEFDHPVDTTLPVGEQIDAIYRNAYLAECNQAMAGMYGLPTPASLIGRRLAELHGGTDNPVNRATLRRFIEAGYRTVHSESEEVAPSPGREVRWLRNNTTGIVEAGHLVRI